MSEQVENSLKWASDRAEQVWKWAIFYWGLHNCLSAFCWVVAISVPSGLAVLAYLPEGRTKNQVTIALLIASGISLAIQTMIIVMRFKERSARGQRAVADIRVCIFNRQAGLIDDRNFISGVEKFLKETSQEEAP